MGEFILVGPVEVDPARTAARAVTPAPSLALVLFVAGAAVVVVIFHVFVSSAAVGVRFRSRGGWLV